MLHNITNNWTLPTTWLAITVGAWVVIICGAEGNCFSWLVAITLPAQDTVGWGKMGDLGWRVAGCDINCNTKIPKISFLKSSTSIKSILCYTV